MASVSRCRIDQIAAPKRRAIVLLVALILFTRLVVGTFIGMWAAIVPWSIAAAPFFARVAKVSLREVDHAPIEAAQAMGAGRLQILTRTPSKY